MSDADDTKRVYAFERVCLPKMYPALYKRRSLIYLQSMCDEVWLDFGRQNIYPPEVSVSSRAGYSYCLGYSIIVLRTAPPEHRCLGVLLHEITHAIGHRKHDRAFVRKYIQLLTAYGDCEEGPLLLGMHLFGVKI